MPAGRASPDRRRRVGGRSASSWQSRPEPPGARVAPLLVALPAAVLVRADDAADDAGVAPPPGELRGALRVEAGQGRLHLSLPGVRHPSLQMKRAAPAFRR